MPEMIKCSKEAFEKCPYHNICGDAEDAFFMNGSDCDKFNQSLNPYTVDAVPAVEPRRKVVENRVNSELTYMDCWHFIAPLIPVNTDQTMDIYVMVFNALKEAEKRRVAKKKEGAPDEP